MQIPAAVDGRGTTSKGRDGKQEQEQDGQHSNDDGRNNVYLPMTAYIAGTQMEWQCGHDQQREGKGGRRTSNSGNSSSSKKCSHSKQFGGGQCYAKRVRLEGGRPEDQTDPTTDPTTEQAMGDDNNIGI